MSDGFVLTKPHEINHFATLSGMHRALMDARGKGIKNATVAVGRGVMGVFNSKSGRFYISFDVTDNNGDPMDPKVIIDTYNLMRMAQLHRVSLVGVRVV